MTISKQGNQSPQKQQTRPSEAQKNGLSRVSHHNHEELTSTPYCNKTELAIFTEDGQFPAPQRAMGLHGNGREPLFSVLTIDPVLPPTPMPYPGLDSEIEPPREPLAYWLDVCRPVDTFWLMDLATLDTRVLAQTRRRVFGDYGPLKLTKDGRLEESLCAWSYLHGTLWHGCHRRDQEQRVKSIKKLKMLFGQ